MDKICGIYKITNQLNNKFYIGQSVNIKNRWKQHRSSNDNMPIHLAIRKYGVDNFKFEIIEECQQDELDEREIYWIGYYDGYNNKNCYNATRGGEGAMHPVKLTDEQVIEIIKLLQQGLTNTVIASYFDVSIKTISDINVGKSRAIEGMIYPIRKNKYGEKQLIKKEKEFTESGKLVQKYHSNVVLQYDRNTNELIKEFPSIREAARQIGCNPNAISKAIKSNSHFSMGFLWYKKDDRQVQNN